MTGSLDRLGLMARLAASQLSLTGGFGLAAPRPPWERRLAACLGSGDAAALRVRRRPWVRLRLACGGLGCGGLRCGGLGWRRPWEHVALVALAGSRLRPFRLAGGGWGAWPGVGAERTRRRLGVVAGLEVEHPGVAAAEGDELGVGAGLDDPAPSSTTIWSARRTVEKRCDTTMRGQPGGEFEEPVVERRLGPHVEVGGRLVEDEHPGAALQGEHRPGQRHPLPLPAGQVGTALELLATARCTSCSGSESTTPRIPARWPARMRVVVVGGPAGVAEDDVLPQGQRVLGEVLEHGGEAALPGPLGRSRPGRPRRR